MKFNIDANAKIGKLVPNAVLQEKVERMCQSNPEVIQFLIAEHIAYVKVLPKFRISTPQVRFLRKREERPSLQAGSLFWANFR